MRREGTIGAVLVALALGGCGGDGEESASTATPTAAATAESEPTPDPTPEPVKLPAGKPFGPRCGKVIGAPALRALRGGVDGGQIGALVASSPELRTFSAVLSRAGLLTRRGQTVFIATDTAFDRLSNESQIAIAYDLNKPVAGHHVVKQRLRADEIIGEHRTVARDTISVDGRGPNSLVVGGSAKVLCGNLITEDAIVYVIDKVLPPRGTPPFS
jgi:hypothetical protein